MGIAGLRVAIEWSGQPSKREKYATALNKSTDFYRFFEKNRIYLPVELCDSLDGFLKSMRAKVAGFGVYLASDEEHLPDGASRKKLEAWADASSSSTKRRQVRVKLLKRNFDISLVWWSGVMLPVNRSFQPTAYGSV